RRATPCPTCLAQASWKPAPLRSRCLISLNGKLQRRHQGRSTTGPSRATSEHRHNGAAERRTPVIGRDRRPTCRSSRHATPSSPHAPGADLLLLAHRALVGRPSVAVLPPSHLVRPALRRRRRPLPPRGYVPLTAPGRP